MLSAGFFYWMDIFMRFRTGFCVTFNLKRKLVMEAPHIAGASLEHSRGLPHAAETHVLTVLQPLLLTRPVTCMAG